jgi:hypothetical protein
VVIALVNLGEVECALGNLPESRRYFAECLEVSQELGFACNPFLLEGLAALSLAESRPVIAATLFGAAERCREVAEMKLTPDERERVDPKVTATRAALGDDTAFHNAWQAGSQMNMEKAVSLVLDNPPDA